MPLGERVANAWDLFQRHEVVLVGRCCCVLWMWRDFIFFYFELRTHTACASMYDASRLASFTSVLIKGCGMQATPGYGSNTYAHTLSTTATD